MATMTPPSARKPGSSAPQPSISSPQMANLLNKTAAAAEEFKRLLAAEGQWAEEKAALAAEVSKAKQELEKQQQKTRKLEELKTQEAAAWRKEREQVARDKENNAARITGLMRELDLKAQAQERFGLERKSWAERIERTEKIASDAKEDARSAGEEVTRLQGAYQELFARSRQDKDQLQRELQVFQEENTDLRQKLNSVQEQHKAAVAQIDALDRTIADNRRQISELNAEKEDLSLQIQNLENDMGDLSHQLTAAQEAMKEQHDAHLAALEFERSERQRQQEFFGQALADAESEARTATSQAHGLRLKVVQAEREGKRLKDDKSAAQTKMRAMEEEIAKERVEWENTYQQLTEAIATKEMEQDAAAAHLEVMLRSVAGGAVLPPDRSGEESPLVAPSSSEFSESVQYSIAPSDALQDEGDQSRDPRDHMPQSSRFLYPSDAAVESKADSTPRYKASPLKDDTPPSSQPQSRDRSRERSRRSADQQRVSQAEDDSPAKADGPRYMQEYQHKKSANKAPTTGEAERVWSHGLRAGFYGQSDPLGLEPKSQRSQSSATVGSSRRAAWH